MLICFACILIEKAVATEKLLWQNDGTMREDADPSEYGFLRVLKCHVIVPVGTELLI